MSPRTLRITLTIGAVVVVLFGLAQLFTGGLALRQHQYGTGAFYCVLGIAGCAIGQALWRTRRRVG